jgi:hypothetical protein
MGYLGCPGLRFEHAVNGPRETYQSRSVHYQVDADGQPNEEGARGRPVPEISQPAISYPSVEISLPVRLSGIAGKVPPRWQSHADTER